MLFAPVLYIPTLFKSNTAWFIIMCSLNKKWAIVIKSNVEKYFWKEETPVSEDALNCFLRNHLYFTRGFIIFLERKSIDLIGFSPSSNSVQSGTFVEFYLGHSLISEPVFML